MGDGLQEIPFGEPRWPPVLALLLFMGLNIGLRLWLPQDRFSGVPWLLPGIELLLLVALLAADPGRVASRESRTRAHHVVILLVVSLVLGALLVTALLIRDLITGAKVTQAPGPLLAAGALVWLGNNLAFGMLYWLMDSGGPIMRTRQSRPLDFAFVQQLSPELAPPGWRPVFLDYLHLGFTNANGVQPHRCDAAHAPSEVRDARAVDGRTRAGRPGRRPSRQRVYLAGQVLHRLTPTGDRSARLRSVRAAQRSA